MKFHSLIRNLALKNFIPITPILVAATSFPSLAQDEPAITQKFTLGTYLSQGDYGAEENTDIRYFPLTYEISRFPWVLSLTVPYLELSGPGDVFLETGNIGRDPASREAIDERGLGDVFVSATYQLPPVLGDRVFLDFSVQAKVPTADEKRDLGTGELDYGPQLDLYTSAGRNTYFSTLGYRRRGKTSLYDLQDTAYASIGAMRQYGDNTYLGLVYDYREGASSSSVESHELMPFVSFNLDSRWNLMVYTIVGFTDSSADRTLGIQVSYSIP